MKKQSVPFSHTIFADSAFRMFKKNDSPHGARDTAAAGAECLAQWRPAWETVPALVSFAAAGCALGCVAAHWVPVTTGAVWGTVAALMGVRRFCGATKVWRERAPLSGFTPLFMTLDDLSGILRTMGEGLPQVAKTGADPAARVAQVTHIDNPRAVKFFAPAEAPVTGAFFGLGFPWTPIEAQRLEELSRVDWRGLKTPAVIRPYLTPDPGLTDNDIGLPILHGVGPEETALKRPLKSLGGGTLILGTTQAGKGVMLTNLVSQAILRGDAVIVIDPKSSKRLRNAVIAACVAAGREKPLEFHPAFPNRGVRIDPLGSWTRPTEIASRVAAVMPPDANGAFTAFAWEALHVMTMGLLAAGRKPTLVAFRELLETGMGGLLATCLRLSLRDRLPGWETRLASLMTLEKEELLRRTPRDAVGAEAFELEALVTLWERTRSVTAPDTRGEAISGLLSVYRHSREHYGKLTASLKPVLTMLTSGQLGRTLSPDPGTRAPFGGEAEEIGEERLMASDADPRPIVTLAGVVAARRVLYLGLDALPDATVASALGSLLLADLAAAAGEIYNVERSGKDAVPVSLFVDEASNVMNTELIELLNKGLEAGIACTCAMQTVSDLAARLGSDAKARMALGNFNNLVALRTKDQITQKFIAETFGRTTLWESSASITSTANGDITPNFRAGVSRSLTGRRDTVVPLDALGSLPNLEFFASLSGGRLYKGRIPILLSDASGRRITDHQGRLLLAKDRIRRRFGTPLVPSSRGLTRTERQKLMPRTPMPAGTFAQGTLTKNTMLDKTTMQPKVTKKEGTR